MTRAADDADAIAARMAEIQEERDAALRGCICPRDPLGNVHHALNCKLHEKPLCPGAAAIIEGDGA